MRALVTIMPKDGVLDPQGEAIRLALDGLGFSGVERVRQGKIIEIDLAATNLADAEAEAAQMCQKLLANEVVESWRVEFV